MKLFEKLINIVYPPRCIFCRELMDFNSMIHICGSCYEKLPFAQEKILATSREGGKCSCEGAVSLFHYSGMVRESLIRYKFNNRPGYYRTFARLMALRVSKLVDIKDFNLVIGIPLHRRREFERGYNQAFLISKALSREIRTAEGSNLVKRHKNTKAQSLLDRQNRQWNVKEAFIVEKPEKVKGKSILLIDDIMTTGSTLEECGRILKQAGAIKVMAIVVATGRNN